MSALTEALVAAQRELPTAIGRDSQGYGYRYTSLDKLIAETRPTLNANDLVITQWVTTLERKGEDGAVALVPALRTRIEYTKPDPVNVERVFLEDTMPLYLADKTMQGLGAAITYARRYAWAAALGIASEEDTDAATLKAEEDVPF